MISEISGTQNPKIKLCKALLQKKNRIKHGLFTVEGIKSCRDAVCANADIEMIFMSSEFSESIDLSEFSTFNCFITQGHIFSSLCDTETPQGILAVIKCHKNELVPDKSKLYIYCDKVSDPGNLGTIIRTADAAGFGGVILSEECADLYSPKTVRASMGSFFNIPVFEGINKDGLLKLKELGFKIYSGSLGKNTIDYTRADFNEPLIIAVGNEANGITDEILKISDLCLKIPIIGKAESLNVGIAAAILMYEALRQRKA